ncbi:hypothetical protein [Flammeovirga pacifica]|uniref:Uncharacterized protein n=1 Tax=Flammeovirga pacifica TaxID=915059 RepID=A0A1S1YUN0_FLAPC|nr:hypothetical protein [Flammeovirga pacifica]OHX64742.1 hypothetical protein NH26_24580 [Flammeovirga pacifica]
MQRLLVLLSDQQEAQNSILHWVIIVCIVLSIVLLKVIINRRRKVELSQPVTHMSEEMFFNFNQLSDVEKINYIIQNDVQEIKEEHLDQVKKYINQYAIYWDNLNEMMKTKEKYGRIAPAVLTQQEEKAKLQMEKIKVNLQEVFKTSTK